MTSHPYQQSEMLSGARVRLVPMTDIHLDAVRTWRADPEVTRYWITQAVPTREDLDEWLRRNRESGALTWTILDQEHAPIGYINLFDLDWEHRKAELALMIGERRVWGQGYARDALATLLRHAFSSLSDGGMGLHKVYLAVFAENLAARRAYAACGFREDGVLRDDMFRDGAWYDQILMSVLAGEFV